MAEPYIDKALAASQDEMVKIFASCETTAELHKHIAASTIQDDLKEWLLTCHPDMLETAASLVKKWGSEDPDDGVGT